MQLHPEQHCDPGGPQPIPTGASCARFLIFPCDRRPQRPWGPCLLISSTPDNKPDSQSKSQKREKRRQTHRQEELTRVVIVGSRVGSGRPQGRPRLPR